MSDHQQLVADRVAKLVAAHPEAPAVLFEGSTYRWGDVGRLQDALLALLGDAGIGADDGIAVVLRNTPPCFGAVVSLLGAGRGTLFVTPIQSDESLAREIRSLRPAVLIAQEDEWQRGGLVEACSEVGLVGIAVAVGDGPPAVTVPGLDRLVGDAHARAERDLAISVLTSGTTGPAKRFPMTWEAAVGKTPAQQRDPGAPGVTINALPLVSIGGVSTIIGTIFRGRPVALMDRFDVWEWAALIREHQPRVAGAPPAVIQMILDEKIPVAWFSSVRSFVTASAPLSLRTARAFQAAYGIPIVQAYGATEFLGAVTGWTGDALARFGREKLGSVGQALPGVRLRTVDPDTSVELGPDDVGRLEIHTERRLAVPDHDGWVRTSDLARIDADGFVWIVGRADDVIIRGGFKIDPHEVEAALVDHAKVRDACVVSLPDERLGAVPVAAVVTDDGADPAALEDELIRWVKDRLAGYKAPTRIRIVDAIPLNSMMKTNRKEVAKAFADDALTISTQPGR